MPSRQRAGRAFARDLYWVFNALFLAVGIALNLLGSALRERRLRTRAEAA